MMWNPLALEAARAGQDERTRMIASRAPRLRSGRETGPVAIVIAHARETFKH